jgi:hypothetical protein
MCFILLFSCKSKKVVTQTYKEIRSDTISMVSETVNNSFKGIIIERTRPVYSQTIIEQPCDSLGRLRPVNMVIGSGSNRSSIVSINGKLYMGNILIALLK